jgi:hypothetical protein
MSKFSDLLADAKKRLETPIFSDVDVVVGDDLVTVRVPRLSGPEWVDLIATHPARKGSNVDGAVGYNIHAVTQAALVLRGAVIEDDSPVALSDSEWADLFSVLSGVDIEAVGAEVWSLNDLQARQHKAALKKARSGDETSSN